jgi:hypothetical protein
MIGKRSSCSQSLILAKQYAEKLLEQCERPLDPKAKKELFITRQRMLSARVPANYEKIGSKISDDELWIKNSLGQKAPTDNHLEWMCYGWSPQLNSSRKESAKLQRDDYHYRSNFQKLSGSAKCIVHYYLFN